MKIKVKNNEVLIIINKRTFRRGDILYIKEPENFYDYLGVLDWCENKGGFTIKLFDLPTKELIFCNCYNCEGNFDLDDIDFSKVKKKGNIYKKSQKKPKI